MSKLLRKLRKIKHKEGKRRKRKRKRGLQWDLKLWVMGGTKMAIIIGS
jgi:hypothetical protein